MGNNRESGTAQPKSTPPLTNVTGSGHAVGIFIVSENKCDPEFKDVMNSSGPLVIYPDSKTS